MTTGTLKADRQAEPYARRRKGLIWTGGVFLTLAILAAILGALWDWNWFRGPLAAMASARLHRQVTISGDLSVHPFSWRPSATVEGVRIANPAWAGRGQVAGIRRIAVQVRLIPLLTGSWDLPLVRFDHPVISLVRDAQGRASWDFSDGRDKDKPLRLPPIHNFIIEGGRLTYFDATRNLGFSGTIEAREKLGADNRGFEMTGEGVLNKSPFELRLTGGPLLNIDKDRPYPFNGSVRAGDTYITAHGAVPKPFDLGRFYMNTTARGPDLADLYNLIEVPLPNSPPYLLHGRLSRDGSVWKIDGLAGRVGSSDLSGVLSVTTGAARPLLTADLRSESLDFPDLGALFGGARRAGKVASPTQIAVARKMQAQARIFPEATLNFERIRKIDADVSYRAATIRDAPIRLRAGSVHVKLNSGLLTADPLVLDLPQGRIAGWVHLNARRATAVTDIDLRLANARLEHLMPVTFQGSVPFAGDMVGRVRLHGVGDSVHDAVGDADGELMLVIPRGSIRRSVAELAGIDLIKGLGLLFAKNQETTPIRCGVAHFTAKGGVLSADRLVIDTGPVLIGGGGVINLDTETLALQVKGRPKAFRLVRLNAPITLSGPILRPKLGIQKGGVIAQGGAAIALGAVLTPLAVLLPFVDAGLAKDADCAALMSESKAQGAPVKAGARGR